MITTKPQIRQPVLLNIEAMSQQAKVFRPPAMALAQSLRLGDECNVKIAQGGISESVWASVVIINGTILTGKVISPTIFAPQHGVYHGDILQFAVENIIAINAL